ncbi:hypothetical protein ACN47A_23800 [Myxococcus fulvus]
MSAPRFRPVAIVGVLPRASDVESFRAQVATGSSTSGVLAAREAP